MKLHKLKSAMIVVLSIFMSSLMAQQRMDKAKELPILPAPATVDEQGAAVGVGSSHAIRPDIATDEKLKSGEKANSPTKRYAMTYPITEDGRNFSYSRISGKMVLVHIDKVNRIMSHFSDYEKTAREMLDGHSKFPDYARSTEFEGWCMIYAHLPEVTKQTIPSDDLCVYALTLLFIKKHDEASKIALDIIRQDENNYGANVILGLLSIRNKDWFPHLEKCFALNAEKTLRIVDWHCALLEIKADKGHEWDFIEPYLQLVAKHRTAIFKDDNIPSMAALALHDIIREKYSPNGKFLEDKKHLKPSLDTLEFFLQPVIKKGIIKANAAPKTIITVPNNPSATMPNAQPGAASP